MKELDFIKIIKKEIKNNYIGDDCAYLEKLGIVITQDSLVENVHFRRNWYTPFQLGYKSAAVNISDILASGAKPAYITVALSAPNNIDNKYIKDFYKGLSAGCHGAEIIGGDITGTQKDFFISITAIGITKNRKISSRSNAKEGYVIVTKGNYGSSAYGLKQLLDNKITDKSCVEAHIMPILDYDFSQSISENISVDYAMMDTSDGLFDALYKIAEASKVKLVIDYNKIPHLNFITKADVLYGGEDYHLIAAIPEKYVPKDAIIIGKVCKYDGIYLDISNEMFSSYDNINTYNHFK